MNLEQLLKMNFFRCSFHGLMLKHARKQAEMNLRDREISLRSFLGFNDNVRLELIIPTEIPDLQVTLRRYLILQWQTILKYLISSLQYLQAQSSVAQAKADKGLNANLTASLVCGIRIQNFTVAYNDLNKQQTCKGWIYNAITRLGTWPREIQNGTIEP